MTDHKISYRYDPKNRLGCLEKLATYSLILVRRSFGKNYRMIKEKTQSKKDDRKKRRRDVKKMPFDPNVHLKDPTKFKKKVTNIVSDNDKDEDLNYSIEKNIVNKFERYFKENPNGYIINVGDIKRVSELYFFFINLLY